MDIHFYRLCRYKYGSGVIFHLILFIYSLFFSGLCVMYTRVQRISMNLSARRAFHLNIYHTHSPNHTITKCLSFSLSVNLNKNTYTFETA